MPSRRFDIVFCGGSQAARMAALLLSKQGKTVLLLTDEHPVDRWCQSSLHLEKLLGTVGGRDCFAAYRPFQVISEQTRITVQPELSLSTELSREFGTEAVAVEQLLNELDRLGQQLDEVLWEHNGLPRTTLVDGLRWRWLCLKRKLPTNKLQAPLPTLIDGSPKIAQPWLKDLFQGLSLRKLDCLRVVDAALLWHHARRPEGLDSEAFERLLCKRFEQFHGVTMALSIATNLACHGGEWHVELADGGKVTAGTLVIGRLQAAIVEKISPSAVYRPAPPAAFQSSSLQGQLSPLLAQRVIIGGTLPLRLTINASTADVTARVSCAGNPPETEILKQLSPVFPFARYRLEQEAAYRDARPGTEAESMLPDLFSLPLSLGRHLLCADETALLPQLGPPGAALLAWSIASRLHPSTVPRHS